MPVITIIIRSRYFPAMATLLHRCFRDILHRCTVSCTDKCVHLRPCAATASSAPLYYANLPLSAVSGWFQTFSRAIKMRVLTLHFLWLRTLSQEKIMALLSLTMPLGFHGVHMAPSTSIRMGFLDGKPGTNALPADLPGQVCSPTSSLRLIEEGHAAPP